MSTIKRLISLVLALTLFVGMVLPVTVEAEEVVSLVEIVAAEVVEEMVPAETVVSMEATPEVLETLELDRPTNGICGDNLTWNFEENIGTLTISGTGPMTDYPAIIGTTPWFSYRNKIETIILESGVTTVGSYAFKDVNVTTVSLPSSLVAISDYAFSQCRKLSHITIPASVTSIGAEAFSYCGLTSVVLSDGLNSIGKSAFSGCSSLTQITIPDTVTNIDGNAFFLCDSLTSVILPANDTTFGSSVFYGCTALSDVTIPSGITTIGTKMFYNCKTLRYVNFPDTLTKISGEAFSGCKSLESIIIPESVAEIENNAFYECEQLVSVTIPEGVEKIGSYGFSGCVNLKSISLPSTLKAIDAYVFADCTALETVSLPSTLETIEMYAFRNCSSLKTLNFPESLAKLGSWSFSGSGLQSAIIPETLTSIGGFAFSGCKELKEAVVKTPIADVPSGMFANCTMLTRVTLPGTLKTVGSEAFKNCTSLNEVYFDGTQEQWETLETKAGFQNEYLFNALNIYFTELSEDSDNSCGDNLTWKFDESTGSLTISGTGAMHEFTAMSVPWHDIRNSIISVVVEDGVTSIGNMAFYCCDNLITVSLPNSVAKIGDTAFYYCRKLQSVTLSGVTTIGTSAFSGCVNLTNVTLSESLATIGDTAFTECTNLSEVYYGGSKEQWVALQATAGIQNDCLFNAENIHFGKESVNKLSDIRYYSDWNEREQRVYFGPDDLVGCLITEETNSAFQADPTAYRGKYVIVQTKKEGSQEILISLTPVPWTGLGEVTAVSAGITIDDAHVYRVPSDLTDLDSYLGKKVLYHTSAGNLIGIEALQEEEGYLTYWNKENSEFRVCFDLLDREATTKKFILSPFAEDADFDYMGETGEKNARIMILTDRWQNVFDLEATGFSAMEDGWSFCNLWEGFGYSEAYAISEKRYEKVFGKSYVAAAKTTKKLYESMIPETWKGNCFGMSVTAILFYLGKLDWNNYNNSEQNSTINSYYDAMPQYSEGEKNVRYAQSDINGRITELIETYQILQKGSYYGYVQVDSTYDYLATYMKEGVFVN